MSMSISGSNSLASLFQTSSTTDISSTSSYQTSNPMKTDLASLISSLSSSDDTSSTDSTTSDLQSKFAAMVSSLGGDSTSASLSDFLQNFSSTLSDTPPRQGNMISTQA